MLRPALPVAFEGHRILRRDPVAGAAWTVRWLWDFLCQAFAAVTEGFRLMRREPMAVMMWTLLWGAAFLIAAVAVVVGARMALPAHAPHHSLRGLGQKLGPFAVLSTSLFLLVWTTTTVAAYRAVLKPRDRGGYFLRLGADELRLAVMTVTSFVLVLVLGGAPAYLLFVLVNPLMQALPALARDIGALGALATVGVDIWLGVRLSLIAIETVAERRFHLTAYWPLARGRFWYLFTCYALCLVVVFGLSVAYFSVAGVVMAIAQPDLGAVTLMRRTSILGLAAILAVLIALFILTCSIVVCACQAYVFRAIVAEGKSDVAIG